MPHCPVSVIIPSYNRGPLLGRAIDSVLRQSTSCSELLLVNDGSTDNSLDLLESISKTAKISFRVFSQENKGPAAARNLAIRQAQFPFLAFLDSDDHWHKRKLEKQYAALKRESEYLISHTREKWLRRGQHLNQKKIHIPRHGKIFDHCLQLCAVGMSTVMVRKELFDFVGFFDESLRCCEDYDLWLRASCKFPFLLIDEPLTVKEGGREDQVSVQYRLGMDELRIRCLRKLLDGDRLDQNQYRMAFEEFCKKVSIFGNGCLKHNRLELGRFYLDLIPQYLQRAMEKFPGLGEQCD